MKLPYITSILPEYTCRPLPFISQSNILAIREQFPGLHTKFPSNPSIAIYHGEPVYSIRWMDYMYMEGWEDGTIIYLQHPDTMCHSATTIHYKDTTRMVNFLPGPDKYLDRYSGTEDMRLMEWEGDLHGVCTRPDINAGVIQVLKLDLTKENPVVGHVELDTGGMEKNWAPIQDHPYTMMYNIWYGDDGIVTKFNPNILTDGWGPNIQHVDIPTDIRYMIRGGSQIIPYRVNDITIYISITHNRTESTSDVMVYEHYFVIMNDKLEVSAVSHPFHFLSEYVEFCSGICSYNGNTHIVFSVMDGVPHELIIPDEVFVNAVLDAVNEEINPSDPIGFGPAETIVGPSELLPIINHIEDPYIVRSCLGVAEKMNILNPQVVDDLIYKRLLNMDLS